MRILVFLLVLANLLFYAFSQGYFGQADNPDAQRLSQQISPERIKIVSRGEHPPASPSPEPPTPTTPPITPPATPEPAPEIQPEVKPLVQPTAPAQPEPETPPPPSTPEAVAKPANAKLACTRWENLPAADADRLAARLADRFPAFKLSRQREASEGNSWWVYIPPQPNKQGADKKAGELRALGITDYFIVQEAGARHLAISLGIFSSQKGAEERLAQLRDIGVRSAQLSLRPSKDSRITLDARGPELDRVAIRSAAANLLPTSEARDCP